MQFLVNKVLILIMVNIFQMTSPKAVCILFQALTALTAIKPYLLRRQLCYICVYQKKLWTNCQKLMLICHWTVHRPRVHFEVKFCLQILVNCVFKQRAWLTISLLKTNHPQSLFLSHTQMYLGTNWIIWALRKMCPTSSTNTWKQKYFQETNVLPYMHWTSNIFGHSATTIDGFWVSLNYPILNFKKKLYP